MKTQQGKKKRQSYVNSKKGKANTKKYEQSTKRRKRKSNPAPRPRKKKPVWTKKQKKKLSTLVKKSPATGWKFTNHQKRTLNHAQAIAMKNKTISKLERILSKFDETPPTVEEVKKDPNLYRQQFDKKKHGSLSDQKWAHKEMKPFGEFEEDQVLKHCSVCHCCVQDTFSGKKADRSLKSTLKYTTGLFHSDVNVILSFLQDDNHKRNAVLKSFFKVPHNSQRPVTTVVSKIQDFLGDNQYKCYKCTSG